MLVLSRKKDECIVINNDITIVVVEIRGDKVRLGVEAPKEVPVHRREVFEAIARGEHAAAETPRVSAHGSNAVDAGAASASRTGEPAESSSTGIVVSGTKAIPAAALPRESVPQPPLAQNPLSQNPRGTAHSPPSADAVS